MVAASGCPVVPRSAADIPAADAGSSHAPFAAITGAAGAIGSPGSCPRSRLVLASSNQHPKGWLQELPLRFSAVAASSAFSCPFPSVARGGRRRGAGGCPAAVVVKPVSQGTPGIRHRSAERVPVPLRGGWVCWEGRRGRGEGCRQCCCCCCSSDAARVFFFCPCFFPRAGTARRGSREGSPRGAGMIHQPY